MLLYVMLCGFAPFQGESPADIYKACASRKLEFPAVMADGRGGTSWPRVSPAAKRMIEQLLQQDPSARPTAEVALQDPWITGDYDSSAVRATIATLRSRFLGWSQLQPSVEVPLPRRSDDETTLRPPRPRQINAPETPKLSFGHLSRWLMGRFGKRRHLKVRTTSLSAGGRAPASIMVASGGRLGGRTVGSELDLCCLRNFRDVLAVCRCCSWGWILPARARCCSV